MCRKLCSSFFSLIFFIFQVTILPLGLMFVSPFNKLFDWVEMSNLGRTEIGHESHLTKVRKVQDQVEEWRKSGRKRKMCTARPAWKSTSISKLNKSRNFQIKLDLNDVVKIDTEKQVINVEPGMMMGRLSNVLLPLGWTIPVVPELDTLTVGGLIAGAGIETSSHQHGFFCDTAVEYEVVLPDGQVVTCSKENDPDLFNTIPGSYGTLGFLTAVTLRLIPASKFVKLDYIFASSVEEALNIMKKRKANHAFVEGFAYSPKKFVLMFGDMVDADSAPSSKVNLINRWYKPFFYKHAEEVMNKLALKKVHSHTEYLPLRDYFHRHTRGVFWLVPSALPITTNSLFMFLFGWVFPLNIHFVGLFIPNALQKRFFPTVFVQDYVVRTEHLELLFSKGHELIDIYPVWLCPAAFLDTDVMINSNQNDPNQDYIDIGFYGQAESPKFHPVETLKYFEKLCIDAKGFQGLYADCYMTKDQFGQMFRTNLYNKVRQERSCINAFPHVYDKVCAKSRQLDV